jgi:putative DNA primase/helicase
MWGGGRPMAAVMKALDGALAYAARGWPVFPWRPDGKAPLTEHGFKDATSDPKTIRAWWSRQPRALCGAPTGSVSGFVLLDVDVKHPPVSGFDTLDELGFAVLPTTPIAHSPSGGVHLHFAAPSDFEIRNTDGTKTRWRVGPGLDWRGWGGGAKLPTPGTAYSWDPVCNLDTVPLAPVPHELLPRERQPLAIAPPRSLERCDGLSRYAEAALDNACRRIATAPGGEQEATVNAEAFAIGTLAGAGAIPETFARHALLWVARQIPSYDSRRPWQATELETKVERAFRNGMMRPRVVRHAS